MKLLATRLFDMISENMKNIQITATDSSSRAELDRRAYYRYLYAYMNYIEANTTSDAAKKEVLLNKAFEYSADLIDQNHKSAYFYDMIFVNSGAGKDSFQDDYLDHLTHHTKDKNRVISTLL